MGNGGMQAEQAGPPEQRSMFYKTRMCNDFVEGRCRFGDTCKYAHHESELRTLPAEAYEILERDKARKQQQGQQGQGHGDGGNEPRHDKEVKESFKKTRLCQEFMNTGNCRYGAKCTFAHGQHELRPHGGGGPDHGPHGGGDGMQGGPRNMGGGPPGPGTRTGSIMLPQQLPPPPAMQNMGGGLMMDGGPGPSGRVPDSFRSMQQQMQMQMPMQLQMQGGMGQGGLPPPPPLPPKQPQQQQQQQKQHQGPQHQGGKHGGPAPDKQASNKAAADAPGRGKAAAPQQPPTKKEENTYVDRVRAICGILNIGNAAEVAKGRPSAQYAALVSLRNGSAFRANPFADDVSSYLPTGGTAGTAGAAGASATAAAASS